MNRALGWFFLVLIVALPASGQGLPGLLESGPSLSLPISLPGLLASLTVTFEQGTGLSLTNLGAAVVPISPNDPGLVARLPAGVTIAPEFPVLVKIEPPPAGGLTFSGIARIQLFSLSFLFPQAAPTRLYAASTPDGPFADITDVKLASTYRVIGAKGGFSEFLLVRDATPFGQVITGKLNRVSQILADNAAVISVPVRVELAAELAAAQTHYLQGNTAAAIQDVDSFLATAEQHSGSEIPDVWRAARDLVNVAGQLRAAARTLRFSLQELGP